MVLYQMILQKFAEIIQKQTQPTELFSKPSLTLHIQLRPFMMCGFECYVQWALHHDVRSRIVHLRPKETNVTLLFLRYVTSQIENTGKKKLNKSSLL